MILDYILAIGYIIILTPIIIIGGILFIKETKNILKKLFNK